MFNAKDNSNGFALIELMVAMAIILIVLIAFTTLFTNSFQSVIFARDKSLANYDVQDAIEMSIADEAAQDVFDFEVKFPSRADPDIIPGGILSKYDGGGLSSAEAFLPIVVVILDSDPKYHLVGIDQEIEITIKTRNVILPQDYTIELIDAGTDSSLETITGTMDSNIKHDLMIVDDTLAAGDYLIRLTLAGLPGEIYDTDYTIHDAYYLAGGSTGYIFASIDPKEWYDDQIILGNDINDMVIIGSDILAVGQSGLILKAGNNKQWNDPWVALTSGTNHNLNAISEYNSILIAVGDNGTILRSTDGGSNWNTISFYNEQGEQYTGSFNKVIYSNLHSSFIAVGDNGLIVSSADGQDWDLFGAIMSEENYNLNDISEGSIAGVDLMVAVGDNGAVLTLHEISEEWVSCSSGYYHLNGIAFSGDRFVVVGNSGLIIFSDSFTSSNGACLYWNSGSMIENLNSGTNLTDIVYGSNLYLASGETGSLVYSLDGINWAEINTGSSINIYCVLIK